MSKHKMLRHVFQSMLSKQLEAVRKSYAKATKDVLGFAPATHNYQHVTKIIEQNLMYSPSDIRYIPGVIEPGPANLYAGKLLSFREGEDNALHELTEEEVGSSKAIIIPGLGGGDTEARSLKTLKQCQRIISDAAFYSPLDEGEGRERRYIEGLGYYSNEDHINKQESENFFNKVILPRITDGKGELVPPEEFKRLTLVGFSIGSREIKSHISYLFDYLDRHGVEKSDIQRYFDNILVLNVGSPVNWDSSRAKYLPFPHIINVLSATDMGTRKPESLIRSVYLDPQSHLDPVSLFDRPQMLTGRDCLMVFGNGVVPNGRMDGKVFRPNKLGHDLSAYVDALVTNEKSQELLGLIKQFSAEEISAADFDEAKKDLFHNQRRYEEREVSKENVECLVASWLKYLERELAQESDLLLMKKLTSAVHSVDPNSADPASICAVRVVVTASDLERNKISALGVIPEKNERNGGKENS